MVTEKLSIAVQRQDKPVLERYMREERRVGRKGEGGGGCETNQIVRIP